MTLEQLKAIQKKYGYEDMSTPQFARAIVKKHGSLTSFLQAFPQVNNIVQGVKQVYNAYDKATANSPWNPQNITEGYRQIANSPTPMATYEQGAKGLMGHEAMGLRNALMNMYQDPTGLMGSMKYIPTRAKELISMPLEAELLKAHAKDPEDFFRLLMQHNIGNKMTGLDVNPHGVQDVTETAMKIYNANPYGMVTEEMMGLLRTRPELGNLVKDLERREAQKTMRLLKTMEEHEFMKGIKDTSKFTKKEPFSTGGSIDKRLTDYYKFEGE